MQTELGDAIPFDLLQAVLQPIDNRRSAVHC
jgi:hypothetical protein